MNGKRWNGTVFGDGVSYKLINGNGFIKEYNINGCIKFEGEYINEERNGKGKEYQHHKWKKIMIVAFEGEYLNLKKIWKRERI